MLAVLFGLFLLGAVTLPQLWVRHVIARHGQERPDLQGTGGELARHLLDRFDLKDVKVEITDKGDHYDPDAKAVRLLPRHHDGRSLSAVAVAAHEVSHALQDANGERLLALRQRLARIAVQTDKLAGVFFVAAPILGVVVRSPVAILALIGLGVALLAVRVVFTLVTLPVEFDASRRAMVNLKRGGYLTQDELAGAKSVLDAAALTYVAAFITSALTLLYWAMRLGLLGGRRSD